MKTKWTTFWSVASESDWGNEQNGKDEPFWRKINLGSAFPIHARSFVGPFGVKKCSCPSGRLDWHGLRYAGCSPQKRRRLVA